MTEKNGSDIVIFINGRIEMIANFASRCSLVVRCGGRWTQQGDKYIYTPQHSTIIMLKNTIITTDIHYNSRLSNNYSTLHNNASEKPIIAI